MQISNEIKDKSVMLLAVQDKHKMVKEKQDKELMRISNELEDKSIMLLAVQEEHKVVKEKLADVQAKMGEIASTPDVCQEDKLQVASALQEALKSQETTKACLEEVDEELEIKFKALEESDKETFGGTG